MWQNYPILQVGTTDMYRKYHPFGIAVCTHETTKDFEFLFSSLKTAVAKYCDVELKPKYLISDAAKSIQNAFTSIFEGSSIVMCWFHMRKATAKRMECHIRDRRKQYEFLADLDLLQLSPSTEVFENASMLFVSKWQAESFELMDYFQAEWLIQNPNWYEGFAKRTPSTNNALESHNRLIKDEGTLRERMDLGQFRVKLFEMLRKWSIEYQSGLNEMQHDMPNIVLKLWTDGYNWARSNVKCRTVVERNQTIYRSVVLSDNDPTKWKTFQNYKQYSNLLFSVSMPTGEEKSDWTMSDCVCRTYFKQYMCEHIIGIALRKKMTSAPPEAKNVPLGVKRKRGRPCKAKTALVIQDNDT